MSNTILRSLEYEKYEVILQSALGDQSTVVILEPLTNQIIWQSEKPQATTLWCNVEDICLEGIKNNQLVLDLIESEGIFIQKIVDNFDEVICFFIAITEVDEDESKILKAHGINCPQLIASLTEMVKLEMGLCTELEMMADELTERYEELNLVYDTEFSRDLKRTLHDGLQGLVQNCAEYLDVAMVALYLPTKNLDFFYVTGNSSAERNTIRSVIQRAEKELWSQHKERMTSIVLNNAADTRGSYVLGSFKILSAPVMLETNVIDGFMVAIKDQNLIDFTNSDRNLLEVMSKKVSSILQNNFDNLTGVINREGYEQQIAQLLSHAKEHQIEHCVINIDIDDFHIINDTISHEVGDLLLQAVVKIVKKHVLENDFVARIGANEFGILIKNCSLEFGEEIGNKIRNSIKNATFNFEEESVEITVSVGVTLISPEIASDAIVESNAQLAVSKAKDKGKNRVESFWHTDEELARRKDEMRWVKKIKASIKAKNFVIYAQTIKNISAPESEDHFEVLLRLKDNDQILSPFAFLPAAEKYHLMYDIDKYVLRQTFEAINGYLDRLGSKKVKVSINLSGQSMCQPDFYDYIERLLMTHKIPHSMVCLEVTESAAVESMIEAVDFIQRLRDKGVKFSLDDFGTGLSSFEYLKQLPVDFLKIDGTFVKDILEDKVSEEMVTAIHRIGHVMGLGTIAEFVENEEIEQVLAQIGVNYAQGFGVSKPRPIAEELDQIFGVINKPIEED
jgi:diguanylate cyclase (GGDEF)-like protein